MHDLKGCSKGGFQIGLLIRSQGISCMLEEMPEPNTGFGLIGMQERSQRLGGQFTLTSIVEQGTEIAVSVPI